MLSLFLIMMLHKRIGGRRTLFAFIFICFFAAAGVALLALTQAATPTAKVEVENAPTVTRAQVVNDVSASSGKALKFANRSWMAGASGTGVANGQFGTWRGAPVEMMSTWSDTNATAALALWQFDPNDPNAEYRNWKGSADLAIGGVWSGETWAAAASGAYDERWRQILIRAKTYWGAQQRGTLYIRFAHEWNGNWFPWSVKSTDIPQFITAWRRFHALKQSIFPESKLVFNTNGNTSGQAYDWRTAWPGDTYVDVYSTDWYSNHWVLGGTVDRYGGPQGLEQHRLFAKAHGKPFAISEWGNNAQNGDRPEYIQYMHTFGVINGGTGPGNLLYDSYFNVPWTPQNLFQIYPESQTMAPNAAAKYKQLY